MFLTAKHISRRTALRGLGATVALPFLDAMVPARAVFAKTPAARLAARTRLVCIEQVHGAAGCSEYGMAQNLWNPAATGRRFDLSKGSLALARAVPRSSDHRQQHRREDGGGDGASRSGWRSFPVERGHVHPRPSQVDGGVRRQGRHLDGPAVRPEVRAGHADSLAAAQHRARGSVRRVRLWLCLRLYRHDQLGRPGPAAADGAGSAHGVRAPVRIRRNAGAARHTARHRPQHPRHADDADGRLQRSLGPADRQRLDQYATNIREIESRIARIEARNQSGEAAGAARRARGRAGFVRGTRQADVRPAGARVPIGHDARVLVQDRA